MECPVCGVLYKYQVERCACGYEFPGTIEESFSIPMQHQSKSPRFAYILSFLFFLILGFFVFYQALQTHQFTDLFSLVVMGIMLVSYLSGMYLLGNQMFGHQDKK